MSGSGGLARSDDGVGEEEDGGGGGGVDPEKLAYILIGVCCGLSVLCLVVVAVSIGYRSETHYRYAMVFKQTTDVAFAYMIGAAACCCKRWIGQDVPFTRNCTSFCFRLDDGSSRKRRIRLLKAASNTGEEDSEVASSSSAGVSPVVGGGGAQDNHGGTAGMKLGTWFNGKQRRASLNRGPDNRYGDKTTVSQLKKY